MAPKKVQLLEDLPPHPHQLQARFFAGYVTARARFDAFLVVFLREREMMHQKRRRWLEGSAPPWKLESSAYPMLGKWSERYFLTIHRAEPYSGSTCCDSPDQDAINITAWGAERSTWRRFIHIRMIFVLIVGIKAAHCLGVHFL